MLCTETKLPQFLHCYFAQWLDDQLPLQLIHVALLFLDQKQHLVLALIFHQDHLLFVTSQKDIPTMLAALQYVHKT